MTVRDNPWTAIPLDDYEKHMSNEHVGQLQLLNRLTRKYLQLIKPSIVFFLGVAGGNGLEHVDTARTKKIIGVDINQQYLDTTRNRFNTLIPNLELFNIDLATNQSSIVRGDLIWAALITEYIGIKNCLLFSYNNLCKSGHLVLTIQSDKTAPPVSDTGIESLKKLRQIMQIVHENEIMQSAAEQHFSFVGREENELPNGKSFHTFHFTRG